MDSSETPINYNLVKQIYGIDLANKLQDLGVTHVEDINKFIEKRRYYPSLSSIWLLGEGGSYNFHDNRWGKIKIYNGTIANEVPFGNEYYQAYFGVPMITDAQYYDIIKKFDTPGTIIEGRRVISFPEAETLLRSGKVKSYAIESRLQMWTGNDSIVTLVDNDNNLYLVKARYDSITNQLFPPRK